jgi:vesicle-associated membrane protein 4
MDPEAANSYQNGAGVGGAAQPSSSSSNQQLPGGGKIKELQSDVEQLTNVMQTNINKVLDRGDRMDTLNERSELLSSRANEFRINSRSIRRKLWWQNLRFQIIIGVVITAVVVIIIYNLSH